MEKIDDNDLQENSSKALIGPSMSVILAALGISSAAVVLPQISNEFQNTQLDQSLVVSAYILAVTALIVPAGRAGDMFGKRNILLGGLILFLFGIVFSYFSSTLLQLVIARLFQGAGAAAMMAMPLAQVREIVPKEQTGRWMGIMGTMSAIGTASGPALAGIIASHFDWRYVFLFQVPITLLTFILCIIYLKANTRLSRQSKIDYAGALALILLLSFFVLFMSDIKAGIDKGAMLLLTITCLMLASFCWIEKYAYSPLIPIKLLKSLHVRISLVMNATVSLIMMGILIVGPYFLTLGLGLTTAQMGLVMSIGPITSAFSGVPAGRLTENQGVQKTLIIGLIGMGGASAAMAGLPYMFGLSGFILAFMCLTPSYQIFLAALNTSVMENTSHQDHGVTSGLLNLSRNFGFILGASIFSPIFWLIANTDEGVLEEADRFSKAMAGTFIFASLLVLSILVLWLILKRFEHED
ncbi:MAG: MFS transporter [Lentilitoribacter sp.]